jgi:hypothetical protein
VTDTISARARVRVTLEIVVPDRWALGAPVEQIFRQAERSAVEALRRAVYLGDGLVSTEGRPAASAQIVGAPSVVAVVVRDGEDDGVCL